MKYALIALALLTVISTAAVAEDGPSMDSDKKARMAQKFEERKAERLKHIGERIAEMQKRQACVQAAANFEAMKSCFPDRMKKRGKAGKNSGGPEKEQDGD